MSTNVAEKVKFLTDPAEAGVSLTPAAGNPTPTGWAVVTPESWHFRQHQICDKVQQVGGYGDPEWWIDMTKALFMVDAWEENPNISPADLTATAYEQATDLQQIVIRPNEVIVGNSANDPHGVVCCAIETPWATNEALYEEGQCFTWDAVKLEKVPVTAEQMKRFEKFSKARNHQLLIKSLIPEMIYKFYYENPLRWLEPMGGIGARFNGDYKDWIFKLGNRGIVHEIEKTIKRLTEESLSAEMPAEEYTALTLRINEMHACKRTMEAHIRWIKRHASVARDQLVGEKNPVDIKRLTQIAEGCENIAEGKPETFFEAVQLFDFWFEAGAHLETSVHSISMRVDQDFWPYYKKDVLEDKTLSRTDAADICASVCFKMHEHGVPVAGAARAYGMGTRDYITCTVGGVIPETGADAWNELTDLWLDVMDGYRLHYPDFKVRWHKKFKKENLSRVCEIARTGMGLPSIKNDDVAIASIMHNYGNETTIVEARDYAIVGCITPGIVRNSRQCTERTAAFVNLTKILETVIFNGRDPMEGYEWFDIREYVNPEKTTEECATYEEFYANWCETFTWFITMEAKLRNMARTIRKEAAKRTLTTSSNRKCIEQGLDSYDVDVPIFAFWDTLGIVDTADCLASIKQLIYTDKKYTWAEIKTAMKADWVGFEQMQDDFRAAPKFGNDDDFADDVAAQLYSDLADISKAKARDVRGQPIVPSALIVTTMFAAANFVGAMPNGRKFGDPLCDGCLNPHADFDSSDSWSRLRSALKIDQVKGRAWIYNQKLDYNAIKGGGGLGKMTDFVEAAMLAGQEQMQFNILGREILEEAKLHPEKHKNLSVRISGYSAYFTTLPEFVQDAVIARVEHKL